MSPFRQPARGAAARFASLEWNRHQEALHCVGSKWDNLLDYSGTYSPSGPHAILHSHAKHIEIREKSERVGTQTGNLKKRPPSDNMQLRADGGRFSIEVRSDPTRQKTSTKRHTICWEVHFPWGQDDWKYP